MGTCVAAVLIRHAGCGSQSSQRGGTCFLLTQPAAAAAAAAQTFQTLSQAAAAAPPASSEMACRPGLVLRSQSSLQSAQQRLVLSAGPTWRSCCRIVAQSRWFACAPWPKGGHIALLMSPASQRSVQSFTCTTSLYRHTRGHKVSCWTLAAVVLSMMLFKQT